MTFDEQNGHFGMVCESAGVLNAVAIQFPPAVHPLLGKLTAYDANFPNRAIYEQGILEIIVVGATNG